MVPLTSSAIVGGCSASPETDDGDTTNTNTSDTGGSAGTVSQGGEGGAGGVVSACGQDCSLIQTPTCYVSVCNEGMHPGPIGACVVVADDDGTTCDDGMFCTVNDGCVAGTCTGGGLNDCGMAATPCTEITCNEGSQSCNSAPLANGQSCVNTDLCQLGSTCQNGLCVGSSTNDCFFEPVPSDCYVSVCDPTTGMCEPQIGNEGGPCVDQTQLCNVGMTCTNGICQGGAPLDCSMLTVGCFNGECNTVTGQCHQVPVPQGGMCLDATDECNTGECDMNGSCIPIPTPGVMCPSQVDDCNEGLCDSLGVCQASPINQGGMCEDGDFCTAATTCSGGVCQNGTPVTTCSQVQDGCCPSNCDATNDQDCACMVYTLSTPFNSNNGQSGNMFDVTALKAIEVQGVEVNFDGTADFEIWYKAGTHVGFENNQGVWTLAGTATGVTSLGMNVPTPLPTVLSVPIALGQTYAFYVTLTNSSTINYTNGTAVGAILASNADLQIKEGIGNSYPFGSVFSPRLWNGTMIYERCGQ